MPIAKFLYCIFSFSANDVVHLHFSQTFYQVDDDEILSLQERLAAYNFGVSSDQSAGKCFCGYSS